MRDRGLVHDVTVGFRQALLMLFALSAVAATAAEDTRGAESLQVEEHGTTSIPLDSVGFVEALERVFCVRITTL